ncbi:type II toxin-antitoxin system Phd/YefM family antitoxin [Streptomyces parvulus]|uniref:type II toxin-antitoxin system Phd/YefM family antitoxin n=1 Tax=Streptomyces TaxID=1883 RepID=UPI001E446632|nr:type II toxin-antitoxin system Phd/YefM family antitoxin [Streptomyces parvulus]MCC9157773.1 type II toxin-antitoxin system Phd/YefM family antitoxin [Streptomyces parvulus]MCE7689596.1 type II toxin-antitoxin system Phd/YefM family antitoxin [Streptomyces parvulus]
MSTISVREFSYNPSAVFARVEKGEAIEVTRHGNVIAILSPAGSPMERYAHLVAQGKIKLKPVTAADRHSMPHYEVTEDADPLALLLAEREEDER